MAAPMLVIARAKVSALLRKYPKAATKLDGLRSGYEIHELLRTCWLAALEVAEQAGWDGCGQETQARAEEAFERLIKENHEIAIRRDKELASAEFDRAHAAALKQSAGTKIPTMAPVPRTTASRSALADAARTPPDGDCLTRKPAQVEPSRVQQPPPARGEAATPANIRQARQPRPPRWRVIEHRPSEAKGRVLFRL
jgi:hypothetical protein